MVKLTKKETKFIETVKPDIKEFLRTRSKKDIEWGVGSYVMSEKGNIYHGVPFPTARRIHGEENAIGNMITAEGIKAKIKIILIVGGSRSTCKPCGMCRVAIATYGTKKTAILCANLSLSKIDKFTISQIYPYPYKGEI